MVSPYSSLDIIHSFQPRVWTLSILFGHLSIRSVLLIFFFHYADVVVVVAVVILVGLFSMQHYGTDRVSWLFAPIVLLWFLVIGGIGIFNIWKYDSSVLKAFSPVYIYRYFKRGGKDGWTSLGGIMLSITGKLNINLISQLFSLSYQI